MPRVETRTTWGPEGLTVRAVEIDDAGEETILAELEVARGYRLAAGPGGHRVTLL